jgi:hypothetical protein
VEYLDDNGKLVTESLRDYSRKTIRRHYASLDDFLRRWQAAERKEAIIEELAEEGLLLDPLLEEVGTDLDPFDLICHIAFDQPPLTRLDRANNVRIRLANLRSSGFQCSVGRGACAETSPGDACDGMIPPLPARMLPLRLEGRPSCRAPLSPLSPVRRTRRGWPVPPCLTVSPI